MHEDRNFVAVRLPPWLDGPRIRALARERAITEDHAQELLYWEHEGHVNTTKKGPRK